MDEKENNINPRQDMPAQENTGVPEAQDSISEAEQTHRYVDRSEEADEQSGPVQAGAVWEGPAYVPGDEEAEKRRIQAIIAQNAHESEAAAQSEPEQPEQKKKKSRSRLIFGVVLGVVLIAAIAAVVIHFTKPKSAKQQTAGFDSGLSSNGISGSAETDADTEEETESQPLFSTLEDKTEEEYKIENLPREIAIPTPLEFFTAGKTFNEYAYKYFYVAGVVAGYDKIEGMRCILIQTMLGNVVLLDSMFTIPDLTPGQMYYFYYLYAGFDTSLGVLFGEYVDYSLENEGIPEIRSYADGTYVVGKDLDAGEYFFSPTSAAGMTIDLYADERYIEKLVSDTFFGGCFLTLEDGEVLLVSGARFAVSTAISLSAPATLHDFMYRVGTDIEPGVYRVYTDGTAGSRYEIYDSSDPRTRTLIAGGELGEEVLIQLEEGQYFNLIHAMAEAADAQDGSESLPGEPPEDDASPEDSDTETQEIA